MIVKLTSEKDENIKRLTAAESIIDEMRIRLKDVSGRVKEDKVLQRRHEAAKKLLDEAVKRLQELGDTKRRLGAAKQLLTASIDRHKNESVNKTIDSILSKVKNESIASKLRPVLESCTTSAEVVAKYQSVYSLIESVSTLPKQRKEPLPTNSNNKINENKNNGNKNAKSINEHPIPVVNQLLQRMNG
jgi:hypothetical protein